MKNVMKFGRLLMVALILSSSISLFSQDKAKIASANEMQMLTKKLALTPEQVVQLKAINNESDIELQRIDNEMKAVMNQRSSAKSEMTPEQREKIGTQMRALKEQRMEVHSTKKEQISAMLNDEQRATYKEISAKKQAPPAMKKRAAEPAKSK